MRTDLPDCLVRVFKKHRTAKNISMYALARLSGLDRGAIGKLESGLRLPSVETASKIASALETPLWKLVKEAEQLQHSK